MTTQSPNWTDRDRLITIAWELYGASICEGCGQDKSRSMNPDMTGYYEVRTVQCLACSALEFHRENSGKSDDRSMKEFVVDTRPVDDRPAAWVLDLMQDAGGSVVARVEQGGGADGQQHDHDQGADGDRGLVS